MPAHLSQNYIRTTSKDSLQAYRLNKEMGLQGHIQDFEAQEEALSWLMA